MSAYSPNKSIERVIAKCISILERRGIYSTKDIVRFPIGNPALPAVRAAICYVLYHHYGFKNVAIAKAMNIQSSTVLRKMMSKVRRKDDARSPEQKIYKELCNGLSVEEVYSPLGPGGVDQTKAGEIADTVVDAVIKAAQDNGLWITAEAVHGVERFSDIIAARHCCMFILRKHYGLPLDFVGSTIGGRDHSTAVYAVKVFAIRAKSELMSNSIYRAACETLGITPRFPKITESNMTESISDAWTRGGKKAVLPRRKSGDDTGGYIVPKNYTEEEKRMIEKLKRDGAFRVV